MCPAEAINFHADAEADTNKKDQLNSDVHFNLGYEHDTLPEWSKGVDSSSTSASCAGSNPAGVSISSPTSHNPTKRDVRHLTACSGLPDVRGPRAPSCDIEAHSTTQQVHIHSRQQWDQKERSESHRQVRLCRHSMSAVYVSPLLHDQDASQVSDFVTFSTSP